MKGGLEESWGIGKVFVFLLLFPGVLLLFLFCFWNPRFSETAAFVGWQTLGYRIDVLPASMMPTNRWGKVSLIRLF